MPVDMGRRRAHGNRSVARAPSLPPATTCTSSRLHDGSPAAATSSPATTERVARARLAACRVAAPGSDFVPPPRMVHRAAHILAAARPHTSELRHSQRQHPRRQRGIVFLAGSARVLGATAVPLDQASRQQRAGPRTPSRSVSVASKTLTTVTFERVVFSGTLAALMSTTSPSVMPAGSRAATEPP